MVSRLRLRASVPIVCVVFLIGQHAGANRSLQELRVGD